LIGGPAGELQQEAIEARTASGEQRIYCANRRVIKRRPVAIR
jgi:hypothetical protein